MSQCSTASCRRITHALEFPNSSVCVIPKQFDSAEVTTRANTDKKAHSKQRTRKAIVPLSTADDARGDDTYNDDNIEEAEAEAAEEEAAP